MISKKNTIFYHFFYGKKMLLNIFKILHVINIQICMHTSTSLKKLMNIYFAVFGVSTENDNILVTHLSSSFDVICVRKKTILRVSLNISGSSKYVVARTMQIFNDLAIVHTSRHILLNILFVIHNAIGLEKE